jgi:hypothetical protein
MNVTKTKKWYWLALTAISAITAILIHLPELTSVSVRIGNHPIYSGIRPAEVISEIIFTFLSLMLLFALNTAVFGFNRPKIVRFSKIILSFIITMAASIALSNAFYYAHRNLGFTAVDNALHLYIQPVHDFVVSIVVTGSCYIACLVNRQQQMLVENHQLRAENFRNQYETLKNWINPHVLFNSLNTLQALIRDTPDKAREYTRELSNVLRYTLQCNEAKTATLRDELEFTRAFIYLLKMRYEDNLVFEIDVDTRFSDYLLPPTTLQHLVENAVKHNEISARHPFAIHIYTSDGGILSVSNVIQPKLTKATGTGAGLDNLSKRYRLLFRREIEISNNADTFCVSIPLINPHVYESADC